MARGHDASGASKGAFDQLKMSNLTELPAQTDPAMAKVEGHAEDRSPKNTKSVDEVVEKDAALTVEDIRKRSEVVANLGKEGNIKIVGGVCLLETGKVTLLP